METNEPFNSQGYLKRLDHASQENPNKQKRYSNNLCLSIAKEG